MQYNVVQCSLFKTKVFVSPGYTGRLGLAVYCYHSDQIFLLDVRQNIISSGHCSPSDKNHCNKISTPPFPLSIEYYAGDIEMYYLISRTQLELTKYIEQLIGLLLLRRRNRRGKSICKLNDIYLGFEPFPSSRTLKGLYSY